MAPFISYRGKGLGSDTQTDTDIKSGLIIQTRGQTSFPFSTELMSVGSLLIIGLILRNSLNKRKSLGGRVSLN